jgi:hypothetical protein
LAYKPEHVVDLDTGAILAAEMHAADVADAASLPASLETARENVLATVDRADADAKREDDDRPSGGSATGESTRAKVEVVADKGYHKAELLRDLGDAGFRTYIPERKQKTQRRWDNKGGATTAKAFHANRARVAGRKSKALHRRRGELVERTFAHICETGAHRRTRLRGIENVHKRYLLQAAAANLGLVMRTAFGYGTPRELAARARAVLALLIAMALWPARYVASAINRVLGPLGNAGVELTPAWRLCEAGSSTGC